MKRSYLITEDQLDAIEEVLDELPRRVCKQAANLIAAIRDRQEMLPASAGAQEQPESRPTGPAEPLAPPNKEQLPPAPPPAAAPPTAAQVVKGAAAVAVTPPQGAS